jgi:hypothetical protein
MDETVPVTPEMKRNFRSWVGLCAQFAVLAVLAVFGAATASGAARPGDATTGLVLAVAAAVLAFLRLKSVFDGAPPGFGDLVLVDTMWGLAVAVPVFTILALVGLFIAHGADGGSLQAAGIVLFIASGIIVFLDLKRVFDRIDGGGHS